MLKIKHACNDNNNMMRSLTSFQNMYYDITGNSGISLSTHKSRRSFTMMGSLVMNLFHKYYSRWEGYKCITLFLTEQEQIESYIYVPNHFTSCITCYSSTVLRTRITNRMGQMGLPTLTSEVSPSATDRTMSSMAY